MNKRVFTTIAALLALSVCLPVYAQKKKAADPFAGREEQTLILKFYPLGELTSPPTPFPYNASLPTATRSTGPSHFSASNPGGGSYGGQSGGFGGGGGQGFYSVPASPQIGGGGLGGGGGGGFGGSVQFGVAEHRIRDSHDEHESLIVLITSHIDPDSWEDNGGKASVSAVDNTLLIRQTAANHLAIAAFLKDFAAHTVGGQPLHVELWWLPVNAGAQRNVQKAVSGDDSVTALHEICESVGGYHGTLQARNRVTSSLASGHRMPLVTGQIPVVGGGDEPGYQPVVAHVNIGITVEVTPQLQEHWQGDGVRLSLQTSMTTITEHSEAGANNGDIDRFQLGSHVLATNAVCAFGRPTVAGSLSAVGLFPDDDDDRELLVVVLLTR